MSLKQAMYELLATNFCLYTKIHGFHFNLISPNFYPQHKFLNDFYDDVQEAIDGIGEEIKALDMYAPMSLHELLKYNKIQEQIGQTDEHTMFTQLLENTETLISLLEIANKYAANHIGLQNFLQDRTDKMEKWAYFLRSKLKGDGVL